MDLTAREYVLERYPQLADQPRLLAIITRLQRFNPDLPANVPRPMPRRLTSYQMQKRADYLRDTADAVRRQGQAVRPEYRPINQPRRIKI